MMHQISVRFPSKQLRWMDKEVRMNKYESRNHLIRIAIHKMIAES